jgi:hypothetical protein
MKLHPSAAGDRPGLLIDGEVVDLSGVDLEICFVSAASDVAEMSVTSACSSLDAVLLQDAPQAE